MRTVTAILALLMAAPAIAQPLTTAFTFQGELRSGVAPASGLHDFRFVLYDAPTGGTQLGSMLCSDNIALIGGHFTVQLDFGSQFAGQQRYLEVQARSDTGLSCANTTGFTTLSPRQNLTAAPNSLFALTATSAAQLAGQPAGFYTNAGNLTSGTLDVARLPVPLNVSGNVQGGSTQVLNIQNTNPIFGVGLAATATGIGLKATTTNTTGESFAGQFTTSSDAGTAIQANANNGQIAINGECSGPLGTGVIGNATHASGNNLGVLGSTNSPNGIGILGYGGRIGVGAQSNAPGSHAVEAWCPSDGFAGYFNGRGYFSDKLGVGTNTPVAELHVVRNWDGEEGALRLEGDKPTLRFTGGAAAGNQSWMVHVGSDGPGNLGFFNRTGPGSWYNVMSLTPAGLAIGVTNTNQRPLYSRTSIIYPARFESSHSLATAVEFSNTTSSAVWEYAVAGTGAPFGLSSGSMYIFKQNNSAPALWITPAGAVSASRFYGYTSATTNPPVEGDNFTGGGTGVYGYASTGNGVAGSGDNHGVDGYSPFGSGVYGSSQGTGVYGVGVGPNGWGVWAAGRMGASGTKSFRIDHPQDPKNKYLLHYSSESPDVTNFYSGKVTLDEQGEATVELPSYFAAINKDPRYSLTAIGAPMPLLHIAREIDEDALTKGNAANPEDPLPACSFRIAGGAPGGRVSWRVESLRNDRWIQHNGAPAVQEKSAREKGRYQHPELFGAPPEEGCDDHPLHHPAPTQP